MKLTILHRGIRVIVALVGFLLLGSLPTYGQDIGYKVNWNVGQIDDNGHPVDITFHDAHLVIATNGFIEGTPAPTTENDGFGAGNSSTNTTHGVPDDTITVDWPAPGGPAPAITGKAHLGVDFKVDPLGQVPYFRVRSATLTNVSGSIGGGTFSTGQLPVPGPTGNKYKVTNSIDWSFLVDDPSLTSPVTFSGIEFWKTASEPPLGLLNSVDFPGLPKTFLTAEPTFVLGFGGEMSFHVTGVDPPEWIIAHYTTTWTDPLLSSFAGRPITSSVEQWAAASVVPESATFSALLWLLPLACGWRKRTSRVVYKNDVKRKLLA